MCSFCVTVGADEFTFSNFGFYFYQRPIGPSYIELLVS